MIRPQSAGVRMTVEDDHTLSLTLDRPCKFSVEPDGRKGPLLLFANPLEDGCAEGRATRTSSTSAPACTSRRRSSLESNQTLYLAGGAVVKAEVLAEGHEHPDPRPRHPRRLRLGMAQGPRRQPDRDSQQHQRRGDAASRSAARPTGRSCRGTAGNVTIRNVKLCNSRVQNDDGINPCNSQDVLITDCFIRSDDDCVALKGLDFSGANSNVERITVENSILWCDRARIFLLGHESRAAFMRNITLRNLDIIHFTMTPFLFEPGEDMRLEDITVEDIRMHGEGQREFIRLRPVVNQYMRKKVPGFIRNVRFKNVTLEGQPGEYLVQIQGADAEHDVQDVTFENVSILGSKLTKESAQLRIGENVQNVRFRRGGSARPLKGRRSLTARQLGQDVRGDDDRLALGAQPPDDVAQLDSRLGVQARGGLVEEIQIGIVDHADSHAGALHHPSREVPHEAVLFVPQVDVLQGLVHACGDPLLRHVVGLREKVQAFPQGQVPIEIEEVGQKPDASADRQVLFRQVVTQDPRAAAGRPDQRGQDSQQGRLAGPVGPDQAQNVALLQRQADVVDRHQRAVFFPEMVCFQHCHGQGVPLNQRSFRTAHGVTPWPHRAVRVPDAHRFGKGFERFAAIEMLVRISESPMSCVEIMEIGQLAGSCS